jgi:general secretion pathway protein G
MYPEATVLQKTTVRRAFTLLELMVVLVIMGLMAGTVVFKTRSYLLVSKQNAAKVEIAKICQALETFYAVYDRYPTNEEGLQILATKSDKFPDGLLNKLPRDPWGNLYQYNNPGKHGAYDVICYGADGREGGEGGDKDITNEDDVKDQSK